MGTLLPLSEFPASTPEGLVPCPFCDLSFKNSTGLRGHAYNLHGIKWEKKPPAEWIAKAYKVDLEDLEVLKPWMSMGISMHVMYGWTWEEVATKIGHNVDSLRKVSRSPAGRRLREKLQEMFEQPEQVAKLILMSNQVNATVDYLVALEWAKEARDYNAVARMTEKMMPKIVKEQEAAPPPQQIQITIMGGGAPMAEAFVPTDFKEITPPENIEEATYEVLER